ncbi:hypothetical protein SMICM304S_12097 [Streptomyces microflavus]
MSLPAEFHEIAKRIQRLGALGRGRRRGTLNLITDAVLCRRSAPVAPGRRIPLRAPSNRAGCRRVRAGRIDPLRTILQINQEMFGPGTVATSDDTVTMGLQASVRSISLAHVSRSGRSATAALRTPSRRTPARSSRPSPPWDTSCRGACCWMWRAPGAWTGWPGITPSRRRTWPRRGGLGGVRVPAGDIVLVRTGQVQVVLAGDRHAYGYPSPGLSVRTPEWFHARDVAAVADSTLTLRSSAGDRGPVAAGARAPPRRDRDAPGPELGPGGAVHSLCGGGEVRLPAHRRTRAVRRHPLCGRPGRGAVIPRGPRGPGGPGGPRGRRAQARFVKRQDGGSHTSPPWTTTFGASWTPVGAPIGPPAGTLRSTSHQICFRRPPAASPSGPRGRPPASQPPAVGVVALRVARARRAVAGVGDLDPDGPARAGRPAPPNGIRTAGQPVWTTALVTSSEISRMSVSASGSSSPIPDPTRRDRAHLRARPTSAGSRPTSS